MIEDTRGLINKVCDTLRSQMDKAVVGLSGGADSTLVVILAIKALGKDNVFGVHMPCGTIDKEFFNTKSVILANHLGIEHETVDIGMPIDMLMNEMTDNFDISTLNEGNMRSRMRMVALYTTCCSIAEQTGKRVRVLGTGNLSEDFIGYDTKGGDALADIFPIGTLVKSEVYQLLDYFSRDEGLITEEMINRVPSAGLWDGQTDEDELGYTYNQMEPYVLDGFNHGPEVLKYCDHEIAKFVYERHFANKHKHEGPPTIDLRMFCDEGRDIE